MSKHLQGSRPGPQEDGVTRVPLWGTSCAVLVPLLMQKCLSPPQLPPDPSQDHPPVMPWQFPSLQDHCLLWMIRTQNPLENLSKIQALRITHTESLIPCSRLVHVQSREVHQEHSFGVSGPQKGQSSYISKKFSGDVNAVGSENTLRSNQD